MTQTSSAAWQPATFAKKYPFLKKRQNVIKAIRAFFDAQGFDETDTPILQTAPGCEVHLHGFSTELLSADQQGRKEMWLHTSPEFAMKKLIAAGVALAAGLFALRNPVMIAALVKAFLDSSQRPPPKG